jgi:hypothetical protein
VEVKSSGYKSHKSFDYFTKKYDVKANERFIVYTKNLDRDGDLTYLPLYMAMCLWFASDCDSDGIVASK